MEKVVFTKSQLLWIYFYLWQIELSIDRAISGNWKEMASFLESRVSIDKVMSRLRLELTCNVNKQGKGLHTPPKRTLTCLFRRVCSNYFLFADELKYIYGVLEIYENTVKASTSPSSEERIELRMNIYDSKNIIKRIIGRKLLNSYGFVSHFHSSNHIKTKELSDLVDFSLV